MKGDSRGIGRNERKEREKMTITERIKNHVCCFCEGELEHMEGQDPEIWGNNPDNACSYEGARCCAYCNREIVLPVRNITHQTITKSLEHKETVKAEEIMLKDELSENGYSLFIANDGTYWIRNIGDETFENPVKVAFSLDHIFKWLDGLEDGSDISAKEIEAILNRMQRLTPKNRSELIEMLRSFNFDAAGSVKGA